MDIFQLDKDLKSRKTANLYLFYGAETFLRDNKIASIKKLVVDKAFEQLNYFVFEGKELDFNQVTDAVEGYPQMAEKKLVVFKETDIFKNEGVQEFFVRILGDIPPYTHVVFAEKEVDKRKKKLWSMFNEGGVVVEFAPLRPDALRTLIENAFERHSKGISGRDAEYMVSICSSSLALISNEIDKLIAYTGERTKVTREDIDAVVVKSVEVKVFGMVDDIVGGNPQRALEALKDLKVSKEQPTVILGLILSKFADMLMVKNLLSQGLRVDGIKKYFEPNRQFLAQKLAQQVRSIDENYLGRMIEEGLCADVDIKTGIAEGFACLEMYIGKIISQ